MKSPRIGSRHGHRLAGCWAQQWQVLIVSVGGLSKLWSNFGSPETGPRIRPRILWGPKNGP